MSSQTKTASVPIAITCGGTGGHIYPALYVAQSLHKKYPLLFIGSTHRLEHELVPAKGYQYFGINCSPRNPFRIIHGIIQAFRILKQHHVKVVFATGGYVTVPTVIAAKLARCRIVLHEQNALAGKTNRLLGLFAHAIAVNYSSSIAYFPSSRVTLTGNPFQQLYVHSQPKQFTLLVTGGSLGAKAINDVLITLLPSLMQRSIRIIWATGKTLYTVYSQALQAMYPQTLVTNEQTRLNHENFEIELVPYLHNIQEVLAKTSVAITRAGAMTLTELSAYGIPAILIPYPFATGNHQEKNARDFEKRTAAICISQTDLTSHELEKALYTFIEKPDMLHIYSQHMAECYQSNSVTLIQNLIESYLTK